MSAPPAAAAPVLQPKKLTYGEFIPKDAEEVDFRQVSDSFFPKDLLHPKDYTDVPKTFQVVTKNGTKK